MKNCLSVLAIVVFLIVGANAEDRRSDRSRLVVMTLNTYFMWDGVQPEEGRVNFPWKFSQTEAEDHMEEVADIIIRNNPDIVNLVEIEGENALKTLNERFLAGRGYKTCFVKGVDTFTGQDLGVLTRVDPIEDIQRDGGQGRSGNVSKGVSKNYFGKFEVNGKKIALIGVHFLARPNDQTRKKKRQAQADLIGKRAKTLSDEGYAVIVLGDFNDYDGDVLDHINSQPITNVLWRIKRMEYGNFDDDLINIAKLVPKAGRYTAFWDRDEDNFVDHPNEHTSIDHILISPSLEEFVEEVEISHVIDPRDVTDHYPIIMYLRFSDAPSPANRVVITSLLPNPPGNENVNEEAIIKNASTDSVDLAGYKLRDLKGRIWELSGTLDAGESKTVKRNNQKMAMTNRGDSIDLVDPEGTVLQTVTYEYAEEGEVVMP